MSARRMSVSACLLLLFLTACPAKEEGPSLKRAETRLIGQALLNRDGVAHIYRLEPDGRRGQQLAKSVAIDAHGNFEFKLGGGAGDMQVVAVGGSYTDPQDTTVVVRNGRDELRANLFDVQVVKDTSVVINPWSDLLCSYSKAHPGAAAAAEARDALETAIGGGERRVTNVFAVMPSEGAPFHVPGDAEVAYIHLGAWSILARSVSQEVGLGDRGLSLLQLLRALGSSLEAEGKLSGFVQMGNGKPVAAHLLRQRFAQAMRRFVQSEPQHIHVRVDHIKGLLETSSRATADMWGPDGEVLDLTPPILTMPSPPTVFGGETQVECMAEEDGVVSDFTMSVTQAGAPVGAGGMVLVEDRGKGTPRAVIRVKLDPSYLEDGEITVTCEASDKWGNKAPKTWVASVNKRLGKTALKVEPNDADENSPQAHGKVTLTCVCTDSYPIGDDACRLSPKTATTPGIVSGGPGRSSATYVWDTAQAGDGPKLFVCESQSRGLDKLIKSDSYVLVKNFKPVRVLGQVHLDTPVQKMRVTAYAFSNGRKGEALGDADAPTGTFDLTITNNYQGPLLLEATAVPGLGESRAFYKGLAFGEDLAIDDSHRLTLLWDYYSPAGGLPPSLNINAATTLAAALATGIYNHGGGAKTPAAMSAASAQAHDLVGKHLQPDGKLDPRLTPVADLSNTRAPISHSSVVLGLFHVGLSRLAAQEGGDTPGRQTSLGLLQQLCKDALNGIMDGVGEDNRPIWGGERYQLSTETLRVDLAAATRKWLRNDRLHGQTYKMSSLHPREFSMPNGYLTKLAEDSSAMFGGEPGKPFDRDGPDLILEIRGEDDGPADWTDDPGSRVYRGTIYIKAQATDYSDVMDFNVTFGDRMMVEGVDGSKHNKSSPVASGEFAVNSALFPDGDIDITLEAVDRLDNESEPMVLTITLDNTPPKIETTTAIRTRDGNMTLAGLSSKTLSSVTVTDADGNPWGTSTIGEVPASEGQKQAFSVAGAVACNAVHRLTMTAKDTVGNLSVATGIDVLCDSEPPVITLETTEYTQTVSGGTPVKVGAGTGSFEVFIDELDAHPGKPAKVPVLAFRVADGASRGAGSDPTNIRVQYAYEFRDGGPVQRRDWMTLDKSAEAGRMRGAYTIPLAYHNLLPLSLLVKPLQAIKADNFIALARADDEHVVLLQAFDEAGNPSEMVEYKFKLKTFSRPVKVACHETISRSNLTSTSSELTPYFGGAVPAFGMSVSWANDADSVGGASLAPSNGTMYVKMPDSSIFWHVTLVQHETTIVEKSDRHDPKGFPVPFPCRDEQTQWWVYRPSERARCQMSHNRLRDSSSIYHVPNVGWWQSMTAPDLETAVQLGGGHYQTYTVSRIPGIVHQRNRGNVSRLQFKYIRGYELERPPGWWAEPDRSSFDERSFIAKLEVVRSPMSPPTVRMAGRFPQPSAVLMDDSCSKAFMVLFEGDNPGRITNPPPK